MAQQGLAELFADGDLYMDRLYDYAYTKLSNTKGHVVVVGHPSDLFDRIQEWDDLAAFVGGDDPIRIGIVYGRRRQGKSWLLRRLVAAVGGIYSQALEQDRAPALSRFGRQLADASGLATAQFQLDDWTEALRTAREVMEGQDGGRALVFDEYPYLLEHSPELPSVLQEFYDDLRNEEQHSSPMRIVLCGSALSVMEELLSGSSPLRGRTQLEMVVQPFDFRTSAGFWETTDPEVSYRLHAILGGTPGYKDLVRVDPPAGVDQLSDWLQASVLDPSSALFREDDYLLREDPRIRDRSIYYSVLQAVSDGYSTPTQIGGAVGKDRTALSHPLDVLGSAGFLKREQDIRKKRGTSIRVADPIVRFHQLITRPRISQFEERQLEAAWTASEDTFRSKILGPHFEELCRQWVRLFASEVSLGGDVGAVGFTVVNDRQHKKQREVDVVGLAAGERRHDKSSQIVCIGEAKSSDEPRSAPDVARLEHIRSLLVADGADAATAKLLLFGRSGFDRELRKLAEERHDVELVDLERLYAGS